jgi:hypothetical protein
VNRKGVIVRISLRVGSLLLFGAGGLGVVVAPACGEAPTCEGTITATCADLASDLCAQAQGCHVVPGTCDSFCAANLTEVSCTPSCKWNGEACKSPCDTALDEPKCRSYTTSMGGGSPEIAECQWESGVCKSPCPALTGHDACVAHSGARCAWTTCAGEPKGPCSAYSGDACPTFLGCDRKTHSGVSTQ